MTPARAEDVGALLEVADGEGFSPGDTPTGPAETLAEIDAPRSGLFRVPLLSDASEAAKRARDALYRQTGLRLGAAYTVLGQQAEPALGGGGVGGAAGDLDLLADWTLLGGGTADSGHLVVDAEYRHAIGAQPPSVLRGAIGSLHPTVNGFNDRGWVVRNLHWRQRLFDGRLRVLVGRADPSDYAGAHAMQSANNAFVNRAFAAATTVPFPGHGFSLGLALRPTAGWYLTVGATNAYGDTRINDLPRLDDGALFGFAEAGLSPEISGLGAGRYRLLVWHLDAREGLGRPSDHGWSVIVDQDLGRRWQVFARYGWAAEPVTGMRWSTEAGIGWRDFGGVQGNLAGLAVAASEAVGGDTETVVEGFVRLQVTGAVQASIGLQGIFDPIASPDDAVAVVTGRLRLSF